MVKVFVDAIDILDALITKVSLAIQTANVDAWDKSGNPSEENVTAKHKYEYWLAYTRSIYSEGIPGYDIAGNTVVSQVRELEFASFVTVIDLRNNHRSALALHQLIINTLNGALPSVVLNGVALEGIKSPLIIKSDQLLAPRGTVLTFRYEALYKISTDSIVVTDNGGLEIFTGVNADIWKSDADHVSDNAYSILDAHLKNS